MCFDNRYNRSKSNEKNKAFCSFYEFLFRSTFEYLSSISLIEFKIVRSHLFWVIMVQLCFLRQFKSSIRKSDYLALRLGFLTVGT